MAPSKKSKSVNRGFASTSDSSPNKDDKSKQKKRKLSDMLGPQWSKHEIERFYEAYRKHGQDWKKVAAVVRSRSIEMVEALYNMNRAYLSLPEGTASVVGLRAMMTDHYNVLEGSGSERDSEVPEVMARKMQKNPKTKGFVDPSKDYTKRQSAGSSDGCLSLLKKRGDGIQPHFPVKKRTPRVPVSCLDIHPNKKSRVLMDANDEGSMLKAARINLNVPHDLHSTYKKSEHLNTSQVSAKEEVISPFPVVKAKNGGYMADEESKEGRLGCNIGKFGNLARYSVESGKSALAEYKRWKKKKKDEVQQSEATLFDNIRKAYKYADEGPKSNGSDGKGVKICRSSSEGEKKRSKKLTNEDELAACDALQTLAEMSSIMPYLVEERASAVEDAGESRIGQDTVIDMVAHSDVTLSDEKLRGKLKKKRSQASKVWTAESPIDFSRKSAENESVADEEVKSGDSSGRVSAISRRCKSSLRSPDVSSSNDLHSVEKEVAVSSAQVDLASQVVNPVRRKNRRKRDRTSPIKDRNNAPSSCSDDGLSVVPNKLQDLKGKLLHSLSWHEVRRWCVYEWFYSAIDYPWFALREFVQYLNHVRLGHIQGLTRVEWGVIRKSLGKPRRFSERFLREQRQSLKYYRESVRSHYSKLRAGLGEGLPRDLPFPLYVGQQVVAIHPKTRECHNGSVLIVDHDNCLVQFHRPDLGVEQVMDIECMPLNPLENMPEAMKRQRMRFDYQHIQVPKVNGEISSASGEHVNDIKAKVKPAAPSLLAEVVGNGTFNTPLATQNQSCDIARMHPQEGYMKPISEGFNKEVFDQLRACADSVGFNGKMHSSNGFPSSYQETASNVAEILEGSRDKAQKMVDVAFKVISVMKDGEDAFGRISEALDANGEAECATNCRTSMTMSSKKVHESLSHQNPIMSYTSEPQLAFDASSMQSVGDSALNDQVPSELITSCVATLLMIQTCTERQYPPGEVAQILDNATASLHPCCPQNLSIYREIQMCMGRIKTQILALVPT